MRIPTKIPVILLAVAGIAPADQVLWDYSLSEIPPGWQVVAGQWEFLPDGAHSEAAAEAYETDWNDLQSALLVLPPGTDSVSISAQQTSATWETELPNTFSLCRMNLGINGQYNIYWNVSAGASDSTPIFVVPPASAGDTLKVILLCSAICDPPPPTPPPGPGPQSTAVFHIWNFVVTAYGDIADLESSTWASIKTGQTQAP